jgi:hypothetical protein
MPPFHGIGGLSRFDLREFGNQVRVIGLGEVSDRLDGQAGLRTTVWPTHQLDIAG